MTGLTCAIPVPGSDAPIGVHCGEESAIVTEGLATGGAVAKADAAAKVNETGGKLLAVERVLLEVSEGLVSVDVGVADCACVHDAIISI